MPINDPAIQRSINDIVDQIILGKVIPIVGYDLLFNEFNDNSPDDFLKRLIKIHTEDDLMQLQQGHEMNGYELINAYYHSLKANDRESFKLRISRTIQGERSNRELIPESYRKLVSIRNFRLFINATFTNTLELALNACRAKGKDEQEIKAAYDVYNFHPNEPTDLPQEAPRRKFEINFIKPVIYNLFGTHDDLRGEYVLTDADYIELIYDLIENKQQKFTNLLSYLQGGYLLFLGSNFPDWFFRFFIRISVGERLDVVNKTNQNSVVDSLRDPSRSVFISQYEIQSLDVDCNELVSEIYSKLNALQGNAGIVTDKGNNKVFISYCRKDEETAKKIAAQFDKKYIEYFLDSNDLDVGNNLNNKIADAIDRCCLFLPVVSNNIGNASEYIWREWKYAIDGKNEIWPVFKNFVDPDMLLPETYGVTGELRSKILDKNNTLGIVPQGDGDGEIISDDMLNKIKNKQYHSRVSGNKKQ
jgi:TIR domain/SIR2-like domain